MPRMTPERLIEIKQWVSMHNHNSSGERIPTPPAYLHDMLNEIARAQQAESDYQAKVHMTLGRIRHLRLVKDPIADEVLAYIRELFFKDKI